MQVPLFGDLKNDKNILRTTKRIIFFILLLIILDNSVSIILLGGINRNYGIKSDSGILMIGHSQLMLAIDKEFLERKTGLKVAKYTREGVNIEDRRLMLGHYLSTCKKMPELVVFGIDPWLFTGEGLSKNSYTLFLPFIGNKEIRDYVKGSSPDRLSYWLAKCVKSSRYNSLLLNASLRGYLKNWSNLKIGELDTIRILHEIYSGNFRRIEFQKELIDDFSKTLDELSISGPKTILLNTPVWNPLLDCQKTEYKNVMIIIDSLKKSHCPSARLVDLVPYFSRDSKLFFDPIHMNPEGQKSATEILSAILDSANVFSSSKHLN